MIGLVVLSFGLLVLGAAGYRLRPAYHIYQGELNDIVEVERHEGPVELSGTATPVDGTMPAPITGEACLVYEYEVEEYKQGGKNSTWRTIDEGAASVPFRLEDRTASVLVEAPGAQPALSTDRTFEVDGGEPEPEPVAQFLQRNADLDTQNRSVDLGVIELSAGNKRRYHERRLEPGEETYVLGQTDYDVEARETMRDISAIVRDGEEAPTFVLSDEGEQGAVWTLVKEQLALLLIGAILVVIGVLMSLPLVAELLA